MENQQPRDERLWRLARKRASFKKSLLTYLVINAFLWAIWWFTRGRETGWNGLPWPLWVTMGWGVGIAIQYFVAYGGDKEDLTEREYNRLRREKEKDFH